MKKLFFALLLQLPLFVFAQNNNPSPEFPNFPVDDQNMISYQDVVKVDSAEQQSLYNAAKKWFVTSFENSRYVIQSDNPQSGSVSGRGAYRQMVEANPRAAIRVGLDQTYTFLISIECKNGRYRYVINDIKVNNEPAETFVSRMVNKKKHKALDYVAVNHLKNTFGAIEGNIKQAMVKNMANDNW
ncbi:DUF4468 domain-containing protein [Chitinophaga sp. MM2321]|uniref:DUF4468 domain-containing protein n=1 Tax=Chitinophaga sp. MM2321 TaxID=3137178 RepID=UPI0032D5734D